jgi:phosphatidylethanolamine-binding protein (PEBP) family uncharacterized protein
MRFRGAALFLTLCSFLVASMPITSGASKFYSFKAEIWADNWFALYVNGKKVGEDSTPFATERSFNNDVITFKATYPLTVGILARDYTENASGLEYIGKPNQQVGDGGVIAQIRETSSGAVVGATNKSWKVFITNKAPLNSDCIKSLSPLSECRTSVVKVPTAWYSTSFKDTSWGNATEFTKEAVGVKDGYLTIDWSPSAKLVWSSDLKIDNTILLRGKIMAPKATAQSPIEFTLGSPDFVNGGILPIAHTCDGAGISPAINFKGVPSAAKSLAVIMDTIPGPLRPGEVDIGNHYYLTIYNIQPSVTLIPAGATNIGTLGKNFQGKKLGYTPPCSQGYGMKEYTITAFALTEPLNVEPNSATQDALLKAMEGKVIAKSTLAVKYQRP